MIWSAILQTQKVLMIAHVHGLDYHHGGDGHLAILIHSQTFQVSCKENF